MEIKRSEVEDLIPRLDKNNLDLMIQDLLEIENLLKNSLEEQPELEQGIYVLQEIVSIIKKEIEAVKKFDEIPLQNEISIFAHLNFLENLLLDVVAPIDDEYFGEDEDEEYSDLEEIEDCSDEDEGHGECCGGHSCHDKKESTIVNLNLYKK